MSIVDYTIATAVISAIAFLAVIAFRGAAITLDTLTNMVDDDTDWDIPELSD